jgi:acyl dehydratase
MVPMRIFNGFDEIKSAVGTEIGVSDWIEVTQDRINRFADATCDEQWIHVDQERAKKELPGGTTIAHGLLSLALTPMFIRSVIGLKGLKNTLNYGADRIRYLSPVPAGSRLRGRVSIAEAEEAPSNGLRVNYRVAIEIEGGQRPACVAELIALHYRYRANAIHEQAPPGLPAVANAPRQFPKKHRFKSRSPAIPGRLPVADLSGEVRRPRPQSTMWYPPSM